MSVKTATGLADAKNPTTYKKVEPYSRAQIDALPEVIGTEDVSGISTRSMKTVQRLARKGAIPSVKVGGKLCFSKSAILRTFGIDGGTGAND